MNAVITRALDEHFHFLGALGDRAQRARLVIASVEDPVAAEVDVGEHVAGIHLRGEIITAVVQNATDAEGCAPKCIAIGANSRIERCHVAGLHLPGLIETPLVDDAEQKRARGRCRGGVARFLIGDGEALARAVDRLYLGVRGPVLHLVNEPLEIAALVVGDQALCGDDVAIGSVPDARQIDEPVPHAYVGNGIDRGVGRRAAYDAGQVAVGVKDERAARFGVHHPRHLAIGINDGRAIQLDRGERGRGQHRAVRDEQHRRSECGANGQSDMRFAQTHGAIFARKSKPG